jgi:FkbM family methyltransferase
MERNLLRCISFLLIFLFSTTFLNAHSRSYSLSDCYGIPFDEKLVNLINLKNGIFIEVGANDGITQSNTKLLEEFYGWKGLLIEPSAVLFERLCNNRRVSTCINCALGSFEEDGSFDGHLMSSINGNRLNRNPEQRVLIRSLQSILDEHKLKHINLFSLDTEGYELNILQGIDFNRTTFDYLLIEIYKHQYDEIASFLASKGYDMIDSFSKYELKVGSGWDGTHNDYLFKKRHCASP